MLCGCSTVVHMCISPAMTLLKIIFKGPVKGPVMGRLRAAIPAHQPG